MNAVSICNVEQSNVINTLSNAKSCASSTSFSPKYDQGTPYCAVINLIDVRISFIVFIPLAMPDTSFVSFGTNSVRGGYKIY